MSTDIATVGSTWVPAETKTVSRGVKILGSIGAAIAGVFAFNAFAPSVITLLGLVNLILSSLMTMGFTAIGAAFALFLAYEIISPNGKINKLLSLYYKGMINSLTRAIITPNPLAPIDERITSVTKDKQLFETNYQKFAGILSSIRDKQTKYASLASSEGHKAIAAQQRHMDAVGQISLNSAQQYDAAAKKYATMIQRLTPASESLKRISQACDITLSKLTVQRNILADEWGVQQSIDGVVKTANRIMGKSKDEVWQMAEMASDIIDNQYGQELGYLDHLKESTDPFMDSIDLDNATYNDQLLQQMQVGGDKLLTSAQNNPGATSSLPAPSMSTPAPNDSVLGAFLPH